MSADKQNKDKKELDKKTMLRTPKGMHDILPVDWLWWDRVQDVSRRLTDFYGFSRIETPILEFAELFQENLGESTDVVQKEMYTFATKGGEVLALRPEGTAPVVRAYLQHSLSKTAALQKMYYQSRMFRHENPQAGRYRQFSQIGLEIVGGTSDPLYDAQIMLIFDRLLKELKIKGVQLKINSMGCRICRPIYKRQLQSYYKDHLKELCEDCVRRFETNPLRLLDCKQATCAPLKVDAPNFFDKLCSPCSAHLKMVLEYLEELSIPYALDNQLVRGFDYYSRTVFEFFAETPGHKFGALPAGGRYDYLIESFGGRPTPAVGGAVGIERLIDVMKAQEMQLPNRASCKVFVVHVGEQAKKRSLGILEELRTAGITARDALSRESLKAQMRTADREGAILAVILGQREIFEKSIIIRDLGNGLQETVPLDRMIEEVKKRLKNSHE